MQLPSSLDVTGLGGFMLDKAITIQGPCNLSTSTADELKLSAGQSDVTIKNISPSGWRRFVTHQTAGQNNSNLEFSDLDFNNCDSGIFLSIVYQDLVISNIAGTGFSSSESGGNAGILIGYKDETGAYTNYTGLSVSGVELSNISNSVDGAECHGCLLRGNNPDLIENISITGLSGSGDANEGFYSSLVGGEVNNLALTGAGTSSALTVKGKGDAKGTVFNDLAIEGGIGARVFTDDIIFNRPILTKLSGRNISYEAGSSGGGCYNGKSISSTSDELFVCRDPSTSFEGNLIIDAEGGEAENNIFTFKSNSTLASIAAGSFNRNRVSGMRGSWNLIKVVDLGVHINTLEAIKNIVLSEIVTEASLDVSASNQQDFTFGGNYGCG